MGMEQKIGGGWCILRTSGQKTLPLAKSLREIGVDAWAPEEVMDRRVARSRRRIEYTQAIVPSFVFAASAHLISLIGIAAMQEIPGAPIRHPKFTVMRFNSDYPLITDESLDPLRRLEASRKKQRAIKERGKLKFGTGSAVRTSEGPFQGLTGIVQSVSGGFTLVCFPGFSIPIKVASWLLGEHTVRDEILAIAA